jgi:hypothetical protein
MVTRDAQGTGQLIGGLEADPADVEGQAVRVALQDAGRLVAVLFEDARGEGG